MEMYQDISGNSGVVAFEIGTNFVKVKFKGSDEIYIYTYKSAGKRHVEKMKTLAENGQGLSTYISRNIKDKYE